jgi:hypothetical protein
VFSLRSGADPKDYILQDFFLEKKKVTEGCKETEKETWVEGKLSAQNWKAVPSAGLAATESEGVLRVYYQGECHVLQHAIHVLKLLEEAGTYLINQVTYKDNKWSAPENLLIKDALPGTSLAAVMHRTDKKDFIYVFYQTRCLHLADQYYGGAQWVPGQFVSPT